MGGQDLSRRQDRICVSLRAAGQRERKEEARVDQNKSSGHAG